MAIRASDCIKSIQQLVGDKQLSEVQSNEILTRMDRMAKARAIKKDIDIDAALKEVEGEILTSLRFEARVNERNRLLTIQAKRNITEQVKRFDKWGEGLQSLIEGGTKNVKGARLSLDYKSRAMHFKYFGSLIADIEKKGLMSEFRSGKLDREIYRELAELNSKNGNPGVTGNKAAKEIAASYDRIRSDMVARQNRAGSYIRNLDGYIMRQTHDTGEIQKLGRGPDGKLSKQKSFDAWYQATLPLLDADKTFRGLDPKEFMKSVHDSVYTGVHGQSADEAEIAEFFAHGSLARSSSSSRVLHFKDADSSFQYNQMFGTKNFSDGMMSDILFRSRNIALMETFGPNPRQTLDTVIGDLKREARNREDAAEQVARLDDWRIKSAWAEASGLHDDPKNVNIGRIGNNIRQVTQLSKMGGVLLSQFADKAFLQSEMAFQGISQMEAFGKSFSGMMKRSPDQKEFLHSMGVALEGLIGNTVSRYTIHTTGQGMMNKVMNKFYDLNFMNWWTDVHKATAGELLSNNLARQSNLTFDKINPDLQKTLSLYDIGPKDWDAIRQAVQKGPNGEMYVTPDALKNLPESSIIDLVHEKGWKDSQASRARVRDQLEEKLRTYFTDRIDYAIPTPGAAERKFLTMGTQPGTPLGEGLRMLTMFKSFPLTITRKIAGREIYGRGSQTFADWLRHDHKGKFHLAQLIAMATVAGYLSGVVKDLAKGRTPKPLTNDEGVNWKVVNDAFLRGGGAGIMGDFLFTEYDRSYKSFSGVMAGPVFGNMDMISAGFSKAIRGEDPSQEFSRTVISNTPFINLFYIRPILDYFVLWNMQEMLTPGYADKMAKSVEEQGQEFIIDPRDAIK